MSDPQDHQPLNTQTYLPPLSPLNIERTRAIWRNLAWQLTPETFVGTQIDDSTNVPDPANAALLALVRGLHSSPVSTEAEHQREITRDVLAKLLEQGPVPVLQRPDGDDRVGSRLDLACELLELRGYSRLLLECIAVTELDPVTAHAARLLCNRLQRRDSLEPTLIDDAFAAAQLGVGLARQACSDRGHLRQAGAVEISAAQNVHLSPAVLNFINGEGPVRSQLDDFALAQPLAAPVIAELARIRGPWLDVLQTALAGNRPILLSGMTGFGASGLVQLLAERFGLSWRGMYALPLIDAQNQQPSALFAVLHAEARLDSSLWLIHHLEQLETHFREYPDSLRRFCAGIMQLGRPIIVAHEGPVSVEIASQLAIEAGILHLDLPALSPADRGSLMAQALIAAGVPNQNAEVLAKEGQQYTLGIERAVAAVAYAQQRAQLRAAQSLAKGKTLSDVHPDVAELRLACNAAMTNRLRAYGTRVMTTHTWDDLVLDAETLDAVHNLARFAKVRDKLFGQWGFDRAMSYGRALSAMFSGPSGTGKTMVASLIARDLGVELYRVDLSRIMSKYIGETEERLGALFAEAAQVGAALLFDEADSLFSQRTEVKSSNDRYANLEVNYLLQKLEEFDGVVILTTNFASSIDEAFVRRVRFRVQFQFPSPKEREKLWEVMLPVEMPQDDEGLDFEWLSQNFELSGGHVRNAVLRGAMLAATADKPLSMRMMYDAAAAEYRELGKLAPHYPFDDD